MDSLLNDYIFIWPHFFADAIDSPVTRPYSSGHSLCI